MNAPQGGGSPNTGLALLAATANACRTEPTVIHHVHHHHLRCYDQYGNVIAAAYSVPVLQHHHNHPLVHHPYPPGHLHAPGYQHPAPPPVYQPQAGPPGYMSHQQAPYSGLPEYPHQGIPAGHHQQLQASPPGHPQYPPHHHSQYTPGAPAPARSPPGHPQLYREAQNKPAPAPQVPIESILDTESLLFVDARWLKYYCDLKKFFIQHGNLDCPYRGPDGKCNPLAEWMERQRAAHCKGALGKRQIKMLESLGFDFDPTGTASMSDADARETTAGNSDDCIAMCDDSEESSGGIDVSGATSATGENMSHQQAPYTYRSPSGYPQQVRSPTRGPQLYLEAQNNAAPVPAPAPARARRESILDPSSSIFVIDSNWKEKYNELEEVHAQTGRFSCPSLNRWIDYQREKYRAGTLDEKKVNLLLELGFDFDPIETKARLPTWAVGQPQAQSDPEDAGETLAGTNGDNIAWSGTLDDSKENSSGPFATAGEKEDDHPSPGAKDDTKQEGIGLDVAGAVSKEDSAGIDRTSGEKVDGIPKDDSDDTEESNEAARTQPSKIPPGHQHLAYAPGYSQAYAPGYQHAAPPQGYPHQYPPQQQWAYAPPAQAHATTPPVPSLLNPTRSSQRHPQLYREAQNKPAPAPAPPNRHWHNAPPAPELPVPGPSNPEVNPLDPEVTPTVDAKWLKKFRQLKAHKLAHGNCDCTELKGWLRRERDKNQSQILHPDKKKLLDGLDLNWMRKRRKRAGRPRKTIGAPQTQSMDAEDTRESTVGTNSDDSLCIIDDSSEGNSDVIHAAARGKGDDDPSSGAKDDARQDGTDLKNASSKEDSAGVNATSGEKDGMPKDDSMQEGTGVAISKDAMGATGGKSSNGTASFGTEDYTKENNEGICATSGEKGDCIPISAAKDDFVAVSGAISQGKNHPMEGTHAAERLDGKSSVNNPSWCEQGSSGAKNNSNSEENKGSVGKCAELDQHKDTKGPGCASAKSLQNEEKTSATKKKNKRKSEVERLKESYNPSGPRDVAPVVKEKGWICGGCKRENGPTNRHCRGCHRGRNVSAMVRRFTWGDKVDRGIYLLDVPEHYVRPTKRHKINEQHSKISGDVLEVAKGGTDHLGIFQNGVVPVGDGHFKGLLTQAFAEKLQDVCPERSGFIPKSAQLVQDLQLQSFINLQDQVNDDVITHYDPFVGFCYVSKGKKEVYIAPPRVANDLTTKGLADSLSNYFSSVDPFSGKNCNLEDWMKIELEEGEGLVIPQGWLHAVKSWKDTVGFSVKIDFDHGKAGGKQQEEMDLETFKERMEELVRDFSKKSSI